MLSPQLRQRVFKLWTLFWESGMSNPLVAIEQITYFLFLKQLEELDQQRQAKGYRSIYAPRAGCNLSHHRDDGKSGSYPPLPAEGKDKECTGHETCKWSYIRQNPDYELISAFVFPWLRQIDAILKETGKTGDKGVLEEERTDGARTIGGQMDDAYFQFSKDKSGGLQKAVAQIDMLFPTGSVPSASSDLHGEIFEYLLSEIQAAGKNGQFRTPRHIIRFMIDLLDPDKGAAMVDPAAGTCGFPTNTILHIRKRYTTPGTFKLEWDGTPHRVDGDLLTAQDERFFTGPYFTAYDNDRTMVRIGWMNMVLHGIENPRVLRQDTLGKSLDEDETGRYQFAFANPPYTGTVAKADLFLARFPTDPRKNSEPITTKSELLFVWLLLDLLKEGGRAAVIVPEGLLFGSTNAHVALRRELLFKHRLDAVISLPAGVFLPYTGVKTSILVFQKYNEWPADQNPRTESVWFYEVENDGYTLDAKRADKPEPNDLWDALAKWRDRVVDDTTYYQPVFWDERWREVDEPTLKVFPALAREGGQRLGIHELFPDLPKDPTEADRYVAQAQAGRIAHLYSAFLLGGRDRAREITGKQKDTTKREKAIDDMLQARIGTVNGWFRTAIKEKLDAEFEQHARKALSSVRERAEALAQSLVANLVLDWTENREFRIEPGVLIDEAEPQIELGADVVPLVSEADGLEEASAIVLEFAKLDGYDVKLRSAEVYPQAEPLAITKSWRAPVRNFARLDDWELRDESGAVVLQGSHDETGQVRRAYLEYLAGELGIYDANSVVRSEFSERLTRDCIEVNGLNLSVARYKPFVPSDAQFDSPTVMLRELQSLETQILGGLAELLSKLEAST